jgi:hypothetical protein
LELPGLNNIGTNMVTDGKVLYVPGLIQTTYYPVLYQITLYAVDTASGKVLWNRNIDYNTSAYKVSTTRIRILESF